MIIHQITALGFSFIVTFLIAIEKSRINKYITPFFVVSIPFVVIILLTNFLLHLIDFPPVTMRAQIFILAQLLILWCIGYFLSEFFIDIFTKHTFTYSQIVFEFKNNLPFIILLSWLSIVIVIRKALLLFAVNGGWSYFGNPQYELEMVKGFEAHMVQLCKVCFMFLIFIWKNSEYKKIIFITFIGLFLAISIIQIKYHILWLILMTFYYFTLEKPAKIQIRRLIIAGIILLVLFNLFWVSLTLAWGTFALSSGSMWLFFARQTANYLVTGPILLDNWLNFSNIRPDWTMIIPLKNLYNVILGDPTRFDFIPLVSLGFLKVAPEISSNIGTAYGTYYLVGGLKFTVAMSIITAFLYYLFYYLSYIGYRYYYIFFNILFLAIGTLTFFGQYFTSLSTFEMPIIFLLVGSFLKIYNFVKYKLV